MFNSIFSRKKPQTLVVLVSVGTVGCLYYYMKNRNKQSSATTGHSNSEVLAKLRFMKDDPKHTSLVAAYLRQPGINLEELAKRRTKYGASLFDGIKSGLNMPTSKVGLYASDDDAFDTFRDLYSYVVAKLKDAQPEAIPDVALPMGIEKEYIKSVRTRFARNLKGYAFPPFISKQERERVEGVMVQGLKTLASGPLGGTYHSLNTPESQAKQEQWIEDHLSFGNTDVYQTAAECYRDWPSGRGIYMTHDKATLVWVNEEDHIRAMALDMGGHDLMAVFERATKVMDAVEKVSPYAIDRDFGAQTSCPTNLGTGMRASCHVALPRLTEAKGVDYIKAECKKRGLDVRGIRGENTGYEGGVYDISNASRHNIDPRATIQNIIKGCRVLIKEDLDLKRR